MKFQSEVSQKEKHQCSMLLSRFSRIQLLATPWTAAHQAPLYQAGSSMIGQDEVRMGGGALGTPKRGVSHRIGQHCEANGDTSPELRLEVSGIPSRCSKPRSPGGEHKQSDDAAQEACHHWARGKVMLLLLLKM